MSKTGKFVNALSFVGKTVNSGSKLTGFMNPTISVNSTKDQFTLDQKAMDLLGVAENDYVVLIDNHKGQFDPEDPRFYLTKGYIKDGEQKGAKIGKNKSFSYSVIWGAMLANKDGETQISVAELEATGLVMQRETKKGAISTIGLKKVMYNLEAIADEEGNAVEVPVDVDSEGNEITGFVYALVSRVEKDHDPKAAAKDEEFEETEENQ